MIANERVMREEGKELPRTGLLGRSFKRMLGVVGMDMLHRDFITVSPV